MQRKLWITVAICLSLLPWVGGCSTNPATGKSQFNIISTDQEISLGEEAQPAFLKDNGGEVPSPGILSYVRNMGQALSAKSERPEMPWEFHVVDSSILNAFALPGGKVFISRGLLEKLHNDASLAGVLGHEIGHVTAQHVGQRMSQALVLQGIVAGLGVAGQATNKDYLQVLGVGVQTGGSVYLLKFSRDQESQADELGVRYMSRLGYDPTGMVQVMEVLKNASSSSTLEILSTHPLPETRIDRLKKLIADQYPYAGDGHTYTFGEETFKRSVLVPLSKLPAPKAGAGVLKVTDEQLADAGWCAICRERHGH